MSIVYQIKEFALKLKYFDVYSTYLDSFVHKFTKETLEKQVLPRPKNISGYL